MMRKSSLAVSLFIIFYSVTCFAQVRVDDTVNSSAAQRQDITFAGKGATIPVARAFAYAPNIVSKCSGSAAAGAQGQFVGLSLAGSYKDEFCERAELIKIAVALGHPIIANQLFFGFPMVEKILKKDEVIIEKKCEYPTEDCKRR